MTAKGLPARPDLGQYRKQAKDLLKSVQAGDPDALSRIRQYHPQVRKTGSPSFFRLSDAQWVIAREHGFESWPKFAARVRHLAAQEATTSPRDVPVFAIDLDVKTDELSCAAHSRAMDGAQSQQRLANRSACGTSKRVES